MLPIKYRSKLFRTRNPFDTETTNGLFFRAVKENCRFQYDNCKEYRAILDFYGISPESLCRYEDIAEIPVLPTLLFKHHKLFSVPTRKMLIRATSSGTKGVFSEIGYDAGGLLCALKMVLKIGRLRGLFSLMPCHYVVFGYKPHKGNRTAVTKTAFGATLFAPALSRSFALTYQNGTYVPDLEAMISAIQKYGHSRFPLRFMGFPSYTYFALQMMEERGIRIKLKKGSKIMLGGGWKQFYTQQVDKKTFYELADKVLGIGEEDIVEFFGAAEHPILYCDCPNHHFHVPAYSRVIIRDVHTLRPLEPGKTGLINLITPMIKATPILSVMTDDLGVLHDSSKCGCKIASPYLEVIGRVGLKDIKTCAAGAADLIAERTL
nr:acyl-protein synthetase [uncultured Eisenbergiella sp.]